MFGFYSRSSDPLYHASWRFYDLQSIWQLISSSIDHLCQRLNVNTDYSFAYTPLFTVVPVIDDKPHDARQTLWQVMTEEHLYLDMSWRVIDTLLPSLSPAFRCVED